MKSRLQTTVVKLFIALFPIIACYIYFRYVVPYHVCFKEQIQLFVYSSTDILPYFSKPAILACLGGDFLTQFLYSKTGGAVVITLLLVAEWGLIFLTLKRFAAASRHDTFLLLWSLFPVAIEWILYPKYSFSLALSVSFIIAILAFFFYTKAKGKIAILVGVLMIPALYMIGGASVFLFAFLAILYDIKRGRNRFVYWLFIVGLSIILPFILRLSFLLTLKRAYFYPYSDIVQMLSLVAMAFLAFHEMMGQARHDKLLRQPRHGSTIMIVVLIAAFIAGLVKFTDINQEKIYGVTIEAYHKNWNKVLEIAESAELQNHVAASYTNLALSQKNLMGERLMDFYQPFTSGLFLPILPEVGNFAIFASSDAYYYVGNMDMAQHAAMVGMIFSPYQRSARLVERLAEINMKTGDIAAAMKYIRILESTLFYRKKVERLRNISPLEFSMKNIMRSSNTYEELEFFIINNPDNLPAINYLLCSCLLTKDISAFFKAYSTYFKGKSDHVPKVYAEALLIYFAVKKTTAKELAEYGIPREIIKSFDEYTRMYEQYDRSLAPMQKKFPNTYWLFFHFAVKKNNN